MVRNLLTLSAVVGLLWKKKIGAYLLALAALLGMVRRGQFLLPVLTLSADETFLLVHSGADLVFRFLILVAAIGWFLQAKEQEN